MKRQETGRCSWVTWSPDGLMLCCIGMAGRRSDLVPVIVPPEWRYQIQLRSLDDGTLLMLMGNSVHSQTWTANTRGVQQLPLSVDIAKCSPGRIKLSRQGQLAGWTLDGTRLILSASGKEESRTIRTPDSMIVADLTWSERGDLWICGAVPIKQAGINKTWRAAAWSADGGGNWQMLPGPRGSLIAAWQRASHGAVRSFDKIWVTNGWVVLATESDEYPAVVHLDVRDTRGQWHQITIRDDVVRAVLPFEAKSVAVTTHRGQIWCLHGSGRVARKAPSLLEDRKNVLSLPSRNIRAQLLATDSLGDLYLFLVHWYSGSGSRTLREKQEILIFDKTNKNHAISLDGPEVVAACIGEMRH